MKKSAKSRNFCRNPRHLLAFIFVFFVSSCGNGEYIHVQDGSDYRVYSREDKATCEAGSGSAAIRACADVATAFLHAPEGGLMYGLQACDKQFRLLGETNASNWIDPHISQENYNNIQRACGFSLREYNLYPAATQKILSSRAAFLVTVYAGHPSWVGFLPEVEWDIGHEPPESVAARLLRVADQSTKVDRAAYLTLAKHLCEDRGSTEACNDVAKYGSSYDPGKAQQAKLDASERYKELRAESGEQKYTPSLSVGELIVQGLTNTANQPSGAPNSSSFMTQNSPPNSASSQQVTSICNNDVVYAGLRQQCSSGSGVPQQSACYRAASRLCQCFLDHDVRSLTPQIQQEHAQWQQCVTQNRSSANSLK